MKQLIGALVCLLPLLSACAGDSGLRIDIATVGVQPGVHVDRLVIDLVATQDAEYPYTCRFATHVIEGDALDFPVTITVEPGDIRWDCVAVRARGYLGGDLEIRAEELFCPDLDSDVTQAQLVLNALCLMSEDGPECADDQVCDGSSCVASEAATFFAETPAVAESCSRGEE